MRMGEMYPSCLVSNVKILTSGINIKPDFQEINNPEVSFYSGCALPPKDYIEVGDLVGCLNSKSMDFFISQASRPYQNGWMSYAKNVIQEFPVPKSILKIIMNESDYKQVLDHHRREIEKRRKIATEEVENEIKKPLYERRSRGSLKFSVHYMKTSSRTHFRKSEIFKRKLGFPLKEDRAEFKKFWKELYIRIKANTQAPDRVDFYEKYIWPF